MHDICWKKRKNQHTHECTCMLGNKNVKNRESMKNCTIFSVHI